MDALMLPELLREALRATSSYQEFIAVAPVAHDCAVCAKMFRRQSPAICSSCWLPAKETHAQSVAA